MAEEPTRPTDTAARDDRPWPIEIRPNGTVMFDGIAIGGLDLADEAPRLTLNLGWMRAAGLRIRVENDPRVDRNRSGLVLER